MSAVGNTVKKTCHHVYVGEAGTIMTEEAGTLFLCSTRLAGHLQSFYRRLFSRASRLPTSSHMDAD